MVDKWMDKVNVDNLSQNLEFRATDKQLIDSDNK